MRHVRWPVMVTGLFAFLAPAASALAAAAGEHEPGLINLDKTLILQTLNFLILIAALYTFAYKPLTAFLAQRAQGIRQSLEEARAAREAAARAQEEYQRQIQETQREARALREAALREVEEEKQRLLAASREEAARLTEQARQQIAAEVRRAKAALKEEAVNLSVAVAERVIGRALTADDHRRLAEQSIRELGGGN